MTARRMAELPAVSLHNVGPPIPTGNCLDGLHTGFTPRVRVVTTRIMTYPASPMQRRQFSNNDRSNEADRDRTAARKDTKPNSGKGAEAALAAWKKVESVRLWWRSFRR